MVTWSDLSIEEKRMVYYRHHPDVWVEDHFDFEFAPYRSESEIEEFFSDDTRRNYHQQAYKAWQEGKLTFDASKSPQRNAMKQIAEPGRHVLRWPNSGGKTAIGGLIILWFLDVYPDGALVSTAGTWSQVKDQLWREVQHWSNNVLPGRRIVTSDAELNQANISIDAKWYAKARAPNKEETFEGVHSKRVMVLMDEAKAIDQGIYNAAQRILRGKDSTCWWVAMSSPASPSGAFYKANNSIRWTVNHHTAYESTRIGLDEIHADAVELGERSPLFESMVLAKFPDEGENTIIPLSEVQSVMAGSQQAEENWKRVKDMDYIPRMGVDVARFGSDETACCRAWAGVVDRLEGWHGRRITETAREVHRYAKEWNIPGSGVIGVDDTGLGGGVTDHLVEEGLDVIPIRNDMEPSRPQEFANWITEAWFNYRELINDGLAVVPRDDKLISQMSGRKYEFRKGKMVVQSKSKMRSRGEGSPDRAEAIMYATGPIPYNVGAAESIEVPSSRDSFGEF